MTSRANRNSKLSKKMRRTTKHGARAYYERHKPKGNRCAACGNPTSSGGRKFAGELCHSCAARVLRAKAQGTRPDATLARYANTNLSGAVD